MFISEGFPSASVVAIFIGLGILSFTPQIINQKGTITNNSNELFLNDLFRFTFIVIGSLLGFFSLIMIIFSLFDILFTKQLFISETDVQIISRFLGKTFEAQSYSKDTVLLSIYANGSPISDFEMQKRKRYHILLINPETKLHMRMFYSFPSESDLNFVRLMRDYSIPIDDIILQYLTI